MERSSGILLHISSLPNCEGIGSFGTESYDFIDFLLAAKQKNWQILPLSPTGYGFCPYQSYSAFAGNPLFIDLEKLRSEKFLPHIKKDDSDEIETGKVNFEKVYSYKMPLLRKAFQRFSQKSNLAEQYKYERFCLENRYWLPNFALFMSLKDYYHGKPWWEWEKGIKLRKEIDIEICRREMQKDISFHQFVQYVFFKQWEEVKFYANRNGIRIIGDMPIYVSRDSADVWANPDIFLLDEQKNPTHISGVPPDYFSKTGQLWGNPLYDWEELEKTNFQWWLKRFEINFKLFDKVRLDHFRGFAGFWAVPFGEKTAVNGEWLEAKGDKLFATALKQFDSLPFFAEDLGVITEDVVALREKFNFAGMKILQFAFNSEKNDNDFLPHNFSKNCIVYTGTHDNDTTKSWFETISKKTKKHVLEYLDISGKNIVWDLIRCAFASTANLAIIPMQDVLKLGSEARMNTPAATNVENWAWQMRKNDISQKIIKQLSHFSQLYNR